MKKILIIPIILLTFSIASCKKDVQPLNDPNNASAQSKEDMAARASTIFSTCSQWHVTYFAANGTDITANYSQLDYIFCPDNTITVSNDIMSLSGNWYLMIPKGGNSYMELDFNAPDFNSVTSQWVADLDGMWIINEMDEDIIRLENKNGPKVLVFQKNIR